MLKNIKPYLDSLKKHLFPYIDSQLIIVDNNSRDKSISILEKFSLKTPQLTIFRNPRNLGFASANNQAAKIAKGKFLFFLNPDTRLKNNWCLKILRKIRGKKDRALDQRLMCLRPELTAFTHTGFPRLFTLKKKLFLLLQRLELVMQVIGRVCLL